MVHEIFFCIRCMFSIVTGGHVSWEKGDGDYSFSFLRIVGDNFEVFLFLFYRKVLFFVLEICGG